MKQSNPKYLKEEKAKMSNVVRPTVLIFKRKSAINRDNISTINQNKDVVVNRQRASGVKWPKSK